MGRGRAKAKQTKVARKLKYSTGNTDLSQLAEELGASSSSPPDDSARDSDAATGDHDDELVTKYADYADYADEPPRH